MNYHEKVRAFEEVHTEVWDNIALRASDMHEFQEAVKNATSGLEAIKSVRELLRIHFPEVVKMPESEVGYINQEFEIAKKIVELLGGQVPKRK